MGSQSGRTTAPGNKLASSKSRRRFKPSVSITCESLEHRQLLSMMNPHLGGELERLNRTAHVRDLADGTGAHSHGRTLRGHNHDLVPSSTTTSTMTPATSTSTSSSTSTPTATGYALGAQSESGMPGWTYGGGNYTASGRGANFAAISGLSGVNPGGPMVSATGAAPVPNTQAMTDLQKLQSDTEAVEAQSQVTVAELTAYAADLKAISPPSGQPSSTLTTAIQTLQSDESTILASGTFTSAQQTQIVNDLATVLTSEGATTAQASKASADLQTIITASGLTSSDVGQLDSDLKAVQTDVGVPVVTATPISTTISSSTATSSSTTTSSSTSTTPPMPAPMNFGGGLLLSVVMGQSGPGPVIVGSGGPMNLAMASPMIVQGGGPMGVAVGGPMNLAFGGGLGLFSPPGPPVTIAASSTGSSTTS